MNGASKSLKTMNNLVFQGSITIVFNHTVSLVVFQWICAHRPSLKKCWMSSHMRFICGIIAGRRSVFIFNASWMSNLAMKQRWLLLLQTGFMRKYWCLPKKHRPGTARNSFRSWISTSETSPLRSFSKSRQYREPKSPQSHQHCQLAGLDFLSSPPFGVTAVLRHLNLLHNDRKSALCIPVL